MTKLEVTILGCGSSGGVPRIGNDWGVCDPAEPKNQRLRCSILVRQLTEEGSTDVLVDTSPDMRQQLLAAKVRRLDGVLFTHDHADQTHGIDDLRAIAINMRRRVRVYFDEVTADSLTARFGYCFSTPEGSSYPPILEPKLIRRPFDGFTIEGPGGPLEIHAFDQDHGQTHSLGFRFGTLAYSADVLHMPEESLTALAGIDCWIVDALRYQPHPSHAHLERTLGWIEKVKPKRAVLTNLHIDLDYRTLCRELPDGVEPAYDGLVITL